MKTEKTPQELLEERAKRVEDAVALKVPDRVPIIPHIGFFPEKYAGITCEESYYDYDKWRTVNKKILVDFEPDMYRPTPITPGRVLEVLDCSQIKWPGHGVSPHHSWQVIDQELMKADEYDEFLADPSDFAVRKMMPLIYGSLEPLRKLPPIRFMLFGYTRSILTSVLAEPEVAGAFEALLKAGQEAAKWRAATRLFVKEMTELGFPIEYTSNTHAPFDMVSDYLRGTLGAAMDMFRQPDKLLEACEKLLPMMIELGASGAEASGVPRVSIALHKGSDGFMSAKQFETFYWPTLKKLVLALIDRGLQPRIFWEGDVTSRLEYFLELPKGKVICRFDRTPMSKAKEVLGGWICISGNVPASLLQTGTPQGVKDYCKELIDVAGKGGGFIMSPGTALDEAKPENVRAMFDFTKEYGVYR